VGAAKRGRVAAPGSRPGAGDVRFVYAEQRLCLGMAGADVLRRDAGAPLLSSCSSVSGCRSTTVLEPGRIRRFTLVGARSASRTAGRLVHIGEAKYEDLRPKVTV
jgi:hypothetical protein